MSMFINASEQEAFLLITDYFASKRMKIVASNPPSYIKGEFGSWTSISLDNAKGEVEVQIAKGDGGSYTNLNFGFFKEYLAALIILIFGTLILCIIIWWRVSTDISRIVPADVGSFLFKVGLITAGLAAVMFAFAIGIVGYSTALTRRRFVEEFNMFVQSLPSKKPIVDSTDQPVKKTPS